MAYYSDLNTFTPTDKFLVERIESIYQSLALLFSTRKGERIFYLDYGINLDEKLFELMDDESIEAALNDIVSAVRTYEPRVEVDYSRTSIIPFPDENRLEMQLVFKIQGMKEQSFTFKVDL